MKTMLRILKTFALEQDGPTATEYAFMLAMIIVVCVGAIAALGNTVQSMFATVTWSLPDDPAPG